MKVSYNWLKSYLDLNQSPEDIGDILTEIGLEVEGIEEKQAVPGGLEGLVVGQVMSCEKHPNADKLSVTSVDIAAEEPLNIVCGAPNVAKGQKVIVATVGCILHPMGHDPFKIKKSKIRGELSQGMICAEDEIGIGSSHDGIMVLPADTKVGIEASDYFNLKSDFVYEIGLTPNRPDAVCHLGVAKDLFAALLTNHDYKGALSLPYSRFDLSTASNREFSVLVENGTACPRYSGIVLEGIQKAETPEWIKEKLQSIGVKTINAIVDITNYILHEFGQPLHAFDLDKVGGRSIVVKTLDEGTTFVSLEGQERQLKQTDLMICDGHEKPMCIAGVYGGLNSGVTEQTKSIFLESAYFDQEWIRKTSMNHNLRTDAAKVYEKGSDPNVCIPALQKAVELICEVTGAHIGSKLVDVYPKPITKKEISLTYDQISQLIGVNIEKSKIKSILKALDIDLNAESEDEISVLIPTNKPDVTRAADVIEEIIRIYGLNKIPLPKHMKLSASVHKKKDPWTIEDKVAQTLVAQGFNEMMGLSMTTKAFVPKHFNDEDLVFVNNTSNVHLEIMRPSLLSSVLQTIDNNLKRQQKNLKLFEFGSEYLKQGDTYKEEQKLSIVITGEYRQSSWQEAALQSNYHLISACCSVIFDQLGLQAFQKSTLQDHPYFEYGEKWHRGNQVFAELGKLKSSDYPDLHLGDDVYYAEISWATLLRSLGKGKLKTTALSKFPSVSRDLSLIVNEGIAYGDIERIIKSATKPILKELSLSDVYRNTEQIGNNKASYTLNLIFEADSRTLTDKEIDAKVNKAIKELGTKLQIEIRS